MMKYLFSNVYGLDGWLEIVDSFFNQNLMGVNGFYMFLYFQII